MALGLYAMSPFMQVIAKIVHVSDEWDAFEHSPEFALVIPNPPYLALVIESWPTPDPLTTAERRRISVAHYLEINGDLVPDPEVELADCGYPIALTQRPALLVGSSGQQHAFDGYTRVLWRDSESKQVLVNTNAKREVDAFLKMWADNLAHQGFAQAAWNLRHNRHNR